MKYSYRNNGTCSTQVSFDLTDGRVTDIEFVNGCSGNLKAIGKILDGWQAEDIVAKCLGNTCGGKKTSCADQLARAILKAQEG